MLFRTRPNRPELDATKIPTAIDIAWSAGIFEGEGCVRLCGRGKRSLAVSVVQKDPQLLRWMRDLFGGSVCNTVCKTRNWQVSTWNICGDRARIFLAVIYRFLTDRRKSQVDATNALDFLASKDLPTVTREEILMCLALHYESHIKTTERGNPEYRRAKNRKKYAENNEVRNKAKAWAAKQRQAKKSEPKVVSIA